MAKKFDKSKYVGKKIQLFPGDTYTKTAIITDVDDLGWTFKFVEGTTFRHFDTNHIGDEIFYGHSVELRFKFIND